MNKKYYTTKEVAGKSNISVRRVQAKIKQGHYKDLKKCPCDQAWLIAVKTDHK